MPLTPRIASPVPAVVKEIIEPTFLTATVRGSIFEVAVSEDAETIEVGDPIIIYRLPASEQWIFLCIITEAPPAPPPVIAPINVALDPIVLVSTVVEPSISGSSTTLDPVIIPSALPQPGVSLNTALEPVVMPSVVVEPTVTTGTMVLLDPIVTTITVIEPAVSLSETLAPVALTATVPEPTITSGAAGPFIVRHSALRGGDTLRAGVVIATLDPVALIITVIEPTVSLNTGLSPVTIPSVVLEPTITTGGAFTMRDSALRDGDTLRG